MGAGGSTDHARVAWHDPSRSNEPAGADDILLQAKPSTEVLSLGWLPSAQFITKVQLPTLYLRNLRQVATASILTLRAATVEVTQEDSINVGVCETCAERGRLNEPVYKMGMCKFCYLGLRHPKATPEQLAREGVGAHSQQRLTLFPQRVSRIMGADKQQNQPRQHERTVEGLVSRNGR